MMNENSKGVHLHLNTGCNISNHEKRSGVRKLVLLSGAVLNTDTPSLRSFGQTSVLLIKTLRVKQWTKNLLLFAGAVFARQILIYPKLIRVSIAFFVFCLLSSALYIINDLNDLPSDRNHPRKRFRPIASGAIPIPVAITISVMLGVISFSIAYFLGLPFFITAIGYAFLTVAYTFYLKRLVIIDVMTIAAGFVLRAVAGAAVINVAISPWLLVCTLLLALFLALTKRQQELQNNGTESGRMVLNLYSAIFLNQVITIVTAATLTGYFLYTFTAHTEKLMITILFVIYGIFRYLFLTHREGSGEEPEQVLWSDLPFMINLLSWIICSGIIIYKG
jgi:4-hydroxybenzoate polyprenyltransferase